MSTTSVTDIHSEDKVFSVEIAAQMLALSPWTIRKWVSERKIASCKIGSRRVIPASEIKRIISESLIERI